MKSIFTAAAAAAIALAAAAREQTTLWKDGDDGVAKYRIPALCTATNGDLVAVCDARRDNIGDLNAFQPIWIVCRRSSDGGATWTRSVPTWKWPWNDSEKWSGSDPSFIVDASTGKIFLFYNVWKWEDVKCWDNNVYRFFVQESSDCGATWSEPREISRDISFAGRGWNFGGPRSAGGMIFITSGSGMQLRDGTLMHTIVRVGYAGRPGEVALFGSPDHGATWRAYGNPAVCGDECKFMELADGTWMINSRWRSGGREIHRSRDGGATWTSAFDTGLVDPQCNGQIIRYPLPGGGSVLLFSNCKSPNRRHNLHVRTSRDEGATWSEGVAVERAGAAYSDMSVLKDGRLGVIFEGAGYSTIRFCTLKPEEFLR